MKLFHGMRVKVPRQQTGSTAFIHAEALAIVDDQNVIYHMQFRSDDVPERIDLHCGGYISNISLVNMMTMYDHTSHGTVVVVYSEDMEMGIAPCGMTFSAKSTLEEVLSSRLLQTDFCRGTDLITGLDEGLVRVEIVDNTPDCTSIVMVDQCDHRVRADILCGIADSAQFGPHFRNLFGLV